MTRGVGKGRGKRKSRVSFWDVVSVQEFDSNTSHAPDDSTANPTQESHSEEASNPDRSPVNLISATNLSNTTPDVPPRPRLSEDLSRPRTSNIREADLEPLGSEEEEDEGGEEPQLTTPNVTDMSSFRAVDSSEESEEPSSATEHGYVSTLGQLWDSSPPTAAEYM